MASHTGQKWSRFFYSSRDFLFKLTFLFQVEMFLFKSNFYFKSRSYFFMSRFLFQVEVFFMSTFSFQEENFSFMSSRDFCSPRGLSSGHFSIHGEMLPRSTCWHFLAMI